MKACDCDMTCCNEKQFIQLLVPAKSESAYLAIGYTVVDRDADMITIRKPLYPAR